MTMEIFPGNREIRQDSPGYLGRPASGSIRIALDVDGKEVCVVACLGKTDKPPIHIPPIHASGSGLSVKTAVFRGREADGIHHRIHVFPGKGKAVMVQGGQECDLFHRGDFQCGLHPVGGKVRICVFISISDLSHIVFDGGGTQLSVVILKIPVDGGAHGRVQILAGVPLLKRVGSAVPRHKRVLRRDDTLLQCKQGVVYFVGGIWGHSGDGAVHIVDNPCVSLQIIQYKTSLKAVETGRQVCHGNLFGGYVPVISGEVRRRGGEHRGGEEEHNGSGGKENAALYFLPGGGFPVGGDPEDSLSHLPHISADAGGKGERCGGNFFRKVDQRAAVGHTVAFVEQLQNRGVAGDFPIVPHLPQRAPYQGIAPVQRAKKIYEAAGEGVPASVVLQFMQQHAAYVPGTELPSGNVVLPPEIGMLPEGVTLPSAAGMEVGDQVERQVNAGLQQARNDGGSQISRAVNGDVSFYMQFPQTAVVQSSDLCILQGKGRFFQRMQAGL